MSSPHLIDKTSKGPDIRAEVIGLVVPNLRRPDSSHESNEVVMMWWRRRMMVMRGRMKMMSDVNDMMRMIKVI